MPKRTITEIESSSPDLPLKRIHTSTPAPRSAASPSSAFSTPYTPSVYSTPADSPTNPLGLKRRVNNLTLPKATPFSKHVALRFQLITPALECAPPPKPSLWNTPPDSSPATDTVYSKNPAAEKYAREGTYRVVQAPLSYSFRLLRAVILFMFSGDPSAPPRAPGHLFSVQHGISIGSPGEITRGRVRVKLSRARDPYYSSRSLADLIAAADAQGQDEEDLEDEEEDASWRWEGEDDLTLGHVWDTRSRDPKRGIIYHHDDKTSVHITLNTQTVPHRKGVGNMPFVFRAYGTAHLDPPRSPPSTPAPGAGSTSTPSLPPRRIFPTYRRRVPSPPQRARPEKADGRGEGDTDLDESSSDEDDFDGGLDTRVWNRTGAFPRFLSLVRASARTSSSSSSSRSRSHSPSPICPPSPSSPARSSSASLAGTHGMRRAATMPYSSAGPSSSAASLSLPVGSASWAAVASSSPVRSLPSLTPAPARPRTRYRVARAARRLLGLTERGLESEAAEEADVVEGRVQGQSKKGRRADARKKDRARTRATRSATTDVWNPFAHLENV
ncbi:hypothetical protein EDB83DRAFT_1625598 [Lactarius deliciosus]|nr:hypothetical protein EDB83DRAFT_1625598 [Lactarius deliciosus]